MLHLNDQLVPVHLQRSSARLRTRSGCGECRQRRKKCDEKRPKCGGCTRNGFECRWPGETQLVDRRRRPRTPDATAVPGFCGLSLPPPVTMPAPFRSSEHLRIYRYFAHSIAPKLVRQTALSRYSHELHIVRLALVHPPLMGALIAIAGMRMSSQSSSLQLLALQSYLFSISRLKTGIMEGRFAGTEDWLLATTTCLCVFENARCDAMPNAGSHLLASGRILSLRRPKPRNASQEAVVFERICVESFLYHAALLALFDPSVNCLPLITTKEGLNLEPYFSEDPDHPDDVPPGTLTSTQPVLDASWKFYLFILDVTKLAQSSTPLATSVESEAWSRLEATVAHLETAINNQQMTTGSENRVGRLYTVAIRILLIYAEPKPKRCMVDWVKLIELYLLRGLEIITKLAVDEWFSYYYLWPLLVVGAVAVIPGEKQIIRAKLSQVSASRKSGPISLAQYRLRKVWRAGAQYNDSDRGRVVSRQLRTLLKDD